MAKKKGKSVSFDAMIKFFMHTYNIPTKRDIDALSNRLDRIERLIVTSGTGRRRRSNELVSSDKPAAATATDEVLNIVRRYQEGVGFSEIKLQTGFGEKKLRNILFRLHKLGRIKRKNRGIYIEA